VGVNLDSYYFLTLPHFNYDKLLIKKKQKNLYAKILDINLIVSTLENLDGV
jgi:hypothetical protein